MVNEIPVSTRVSTVLSVLKSDFFNEKAIDVSRGDLKFLKMMSDDVQFKDGQF